MNIQRTSDRTIMALSFSLVVLFLLSIVNAFLPQVQMLLFQGNILLPSIILKVASIAIVVIAIAINFRDLRKQVFTKYHLLWWLFFAYLAVDFLLLYFIEGVKPVEIIFGYNSYYFFLLMIPFIYLFQGTIQQSKVKKWFLGISIFLVLLGLLQYFFNHPLLPVESADQSFQVNSWNYYGHVRAFSLFDSGLSFGHYIALLSSLILVFLFQQLNNKKGRNALIFLIILIVTTYATLTRIIYLEVGLTLLTTLFFLLLNKSKRWYQFLPFIYTGLGILVIIIAPVLSGIFSDSSLMKNQSLIMRLYQWENVLNQIMGNGVFQFFFGNGHIQNNKYPAIDAGLIDNCFLAVFLQIGLFGFILWFMMMWAMKARLIKAALNTPNPVTISIAAIFSSWILTSFFNISFTIYPILFMFGLLIQNSGKRSKVKADKGNSFNLLTNATICDQKPTGLGVYTENLLSCFDKNENVNNQVIVNQNIGMTKRPENVYHSPDALLSSKGWKAQLKRIFWLQWVLPYLAKENDYLFNPVPEGSFFLMKNKQVTVIHDILPVMFKEEYNKSHYYYKYAAPLLLKNSVKIIVPSESTKKDVCMLYKIAEEKVIVVPNGYDKDHFYPRTEKQIQQVKDKYSLDQFILYVGNFYPHKNIDTMIKGFGKIANQHPDLKFVIVGSKEHWNYENIIKVIKDENLEERIIFLDYVPFAELPVLYSACKAFAYASLYEGFGLPLLEAMACGAPVISSNTSSLPEVTGDAAILVNPKEDQEIANGMDAILSNSELRDELVQKGLERVKLFDWNFTANGILNVLQKEHRKGNKQ